MTDLLRAEDKEVDDRIDCRPDTKTWVMAWRKQTGSDLVIRSHFLSLPVRRASIYSKRHNGQCSGPMSVIQNVEL